MNKSLKKAWFIVILLGLALLIIKSVGAAEFDYALQPRQVAPQTYVLEGRTEDFSRQNGGFIVNTGFIVTEAGVIVIDTGPSRRFAEQQKAAIAKLSDKPIIRVYLTHHHPDHFLGNQVYDGVPIYALPATRQGIQLEGQGFSDNMYRMVGDWMRGTQVLAPNTEAKPGREVIGGHELELIALQGHTSGDLLIFDHSTGVLFAGDLVFNQRAATTPHADISAWLQALDTLQRLAFKVLVVGHGPVATGAEPIAQTREYLQWLVSTLQVGAENGLDMTEVMQTPIPEAFRNLSLVKSELRRSVTHLFPKMEDKVLKTVEP